MCGFLLLREVGVPFKLGRKMLSIVIQGKVTGRLEIRDGMGGSIEGEGEGVTR